MGKKIKKTPTVDVVPQIVSAANELPATQCYNAQELPATQCYNAQELPATQCYFAEEPPAAQPYNGTQTCEEPPMTQCYIGKRLPATPQKRKSARAQQSVPVRKTPSVTQTAAKQARTSAGGRRFGKFA